MENSELGVFSWFVFGKVRASRIAGFGCICWLTFKPSCTCKWEPARLTWKGSVIFDRKGTGEGLFEAKSLLDTVVLGLASKLAPRSHQRDSPNF